MERNTRQRDAIREVFETVARPLSPSEVLASAQQRVDGLAIATVYRTINALVGSGWLAPVELPGEAARYERATAEHHHHFQCRECSCVFEIHGCPGDLRHLAPPGFELERHDVTLYGRCAQCARS